jgi:hypothetical protein
VINLSFQVHSQDAPKYTLSPLPSIPPSLFSITHVSTLSWTRPIALEGILPACLTVCSKGCYRDPLKHTPEYTFKWENYIIHNAVQVQMSQSRQKIILSTLTSDLFLQPMLFQKSIISSFVFLLLSIPLYIPSHTFLHLKIGTLGFVDFFELVLGDLWTSFLPKWSRTTVDS